MKAFSSRDRLLHARLVAQDAAAGQGCCWGQQPAPPRALPHSVSRRSRMLSMNVLLPAPGTPVTPMRIDRPAVWQQAPPAATAPAS